MSLLAITGATGFVGSAVLDAARAEGHAVRALARRDQPAREGVTWVRGDLNDAAALAALVQGADAVIHVAGLTNTPDPAAFESANVTGTANVLAAMRAAGVKRLVFVSSLAARMPGLSLYGASKAKAEALVEGSGLDWTRAPARGLWPARCRLPRDVPHGEMGLRPPAAGRGELDHPCRRPCKVAGYPCRVLK